MKRLLNNAVIDKCGDCEHRKYDRDFLCFVCKAEHYVKWFKIEENHKIHPDCPLHDCEVINDLPCYLFDPLHKVSGILLTDIEKIIIVKKHAEKNENNGDN